MGTTSSKHIWSMRILGPKSSGAGDSLVKIKISCPGSGAIKLNEYCVHPVLLKGIKIFCIKCPSAYIPNLPLKLDVGKSFAQKVIQYCLFA